MSTRTRIGPEPAISAGDMSADITSKITVLQSASILNYEYVWSGTSPVGTLVVEGSNNFSLYPDGTVNNAGDWNALPLSLSGTTVLAIPISGNTGIGTVNLSLNGDYAIRTRYIFGSGTGSLNATVNGKVA